MADQGNEGYLSAFLRRQRIRESAKFLFGKVLDVGCGSGLLSKYVPSSDYTGVEPDEDSRTAAVYHTTLPVLSRKNCLKKVILTRWPCWQSLSMLMTRRDSWSVWQL